MIGSKIQQNLLVIFIALAMGCFALLAFVFGGPTSYVNWTKIHAVVLESDDWGLAGFVPQGDLWQDIDRKSFLKGPAFPDVYWESTLEDSRMVSSLCEIFARYHGADGLPVIFQPNYVMSSLEYCGDNNSDPWVRHDFPQFPAQYQRPGMWEAVQTGIAMGLWYPEFHATWHYDPNMRKEEGLATSLAQGLTEQGVLLFPGSELARELGPWRDAGDLKAELVHSLEVFSNAFGRKPDSIIAPDYTWNERNEQLWEDQGLVIIQGKREQRNPDYDYNPINRIRKLLSRRVGYVFKPSRIYLERNCRFEPVQMDDPNNPVAMAAMVDEAVRQTLAAWKKGQPAIVETHRINFAHIDPQIVALGQKQLDAYLGELLSGEGKEAVFMVDTEIAQLYRRGTSVCLRGSTIVLRNATHSTRAVAIPQEFIPPSQGNESSKSQTRFFMVGPGEVIQLSIHDF